MIFISDTSGDIHEAKEVKVEYIVGILEGYQSEASLNKAHPDIIVKNFQEFYDLVATQEVSK